MISVRHILAMAIFLCLAGPIAAGAADQGSDGCRLHRGLVILAEFPDMPHAVERARVEERFLGKLNGYVRQASYGRACIGGEVTARWYRLPDSIARYRISSRNHDVDRSRLRRLVADAFEAAEADVDPSAYDFVAIVLGATQREYGMIGLSVYPGMLGLGARNPLPSKDGRPVKGVVIFSYQAHLGTLFHDVAHVIGGILPNGNRAVPCLYDHDLQARPGDQREVFKASLINMGYWDPMSSHFNRWEAPPPGPSSWTKLRLGWLPEDKLAVVRPGETREIILGPLADGQSETLAIRIPLSPTTYLLAENRQPIGFDSSLPGQGVLVMRADDNVAESQKGRAPVRLVDADPSVPALMGAAFDIGKRERFTDPDTGVSIELVERVGQAYRVRVGMAP